MAWESPISERTRVAPVVRTRAGFDTPAHFGNPDAEYQAATERAAIFDTSFAGKVEVAGPEAPQFLHNLSTNDIQSLPLGGGCEAFFCNQKARALFHARIYHLRLGSRDAMWIDVTAGYDSKLMAHLDRHLIAEQVELSNRTSEFAQFHVAGSSARSVLSEAISEPVPDLALHQHMERSIGSATAHIRRNDQLAVPGFDVVCLNTRAIAVWDRLVKLGAEPAGADVFEILRVESGSPVYGVDLDENRFVLEVGRTDAVSYTKGCFLGQEPIVMARDRAGFLNRYFRGLRFNGKARAGDKLVGDSDAGVITSVADSPRLGPIGLGYVRRSHENPGTVLYLGDSISDQATVALLPFISSQ